MSAGRYVVFKTTWNHWQGPSKAWLEEIGARVVAKAETGGWSYEHQWLGLAFSTASAAAEWVRRESDRWGETYPRFQTVRELESHLDDVSMAQYLGLGR